VRIRRIGAALASISICLVASSPALATVNHGDFFGTGVDFIAVSETTLSAGDAEPLWNPPSLLGDQLLFFPPAFLSQCVGAGNSDVTTSELTTTITAHPGGHIDNVMLAETGDSTLVSFPPFGTAATNSSASLSGTLTVIETTGGPIAPVVIPFTGTFTPSSSFALPTDFGVKNWTGSMSVNVSSVVANATKAVLTLNNHLTSNCGPGNSNAKIQKKQVSGPAVAILVNPIACSLEVDKTCCVTQPVLPDFDICDGQMERLILKFTGDKCGHSSCDQGGSFQCFGRRPIGDPASVFVLGGSGVQVSPSSGLEHGDTIEITSSSGILPSKTTIKVADDWWRRQILKIDTGCQRAIACGDQLGAFEVVGVESTLGGFVDCNGPPPEPECAPAGDPPGTQCNDAIVDMVLEYNGQACQVPLPNPQGGYASCYGNATGATNVGIVYTGPYGYKETVTPASNINNGDRIRVTATYPGGLYPIQSFKITDSSGVRQKIDMKVSCLKPFALGDEFGSLKVVEFTTKSGQHVALGDGPAGPFDACEVPLGPPGPHCTSDLQSLTLVYIGNYLGAGCTVSNPQGGYGTCSGVADPGDPVSVAPSFGLTAEPDDLIEFGDLVTFTKTSGGDMPDFTQFTVTGAGGSQTIKIKTSCWKPLSLGDRFGSFVVFGMDREEEGPISLGGNIQYQYKVTNPSDVTVDNIQVDDDQLGVIASGVSLAPGGEQTFTKAATLFGTTTNVATVTGDVNGDICEPGTDTVTVGVLAPPQGSFSCSEPIGEITMIWNGTQTVDIKAWKGAVGGVLLNQFDDVAPGDAITVSGLGSSPPTFEIFNSAGIVKLGESQFDLTCNDPSMNGLEDCGKNNGNGKYNLSNLNNDWLLEGMVDSNEELACTPGLVPNPPACGFGPELVVVMPALMWWHRRRMRKAA
jgi:hypothetical protein